MVKKPTRKTARKPTRKTSAARYIITATFKMRSGKLTATKASGLKKRLKARGATIAIQKV